MKKILALLLTLVMLSAMVTCVSADTYSVADNIKLRAAGGTGLSVQNGDTVVLSEGASNPNWSNAQMMVRDSLTDGFTVKIKNIVWDKTENNAVGIVYSNHQTAAYSGATTFGGNSCFVLLVMKDGSVVLWGNGFNSNHTFGKWVGVVITGKKVEANLTEFTYIMAPNEDNTVYSFFVNNTLIYEYNIEKMAATSSSYHNNGIFATPEIPCNFGFQVIDGTGSYQNGWGNVPVGTLSYTIDEVNSVGIAPEIIEPDEPEDTTGNTGGTVTDKPTPDTIAKITKAPETTANAGEGTGSFNTTLIIIAASAAVVAIAAVIIIIVISKKKKK